MIYMQIIDERVIFETNKVRIGVLVFIFVFQLIPMLIYHFSEYLTTDFDYIIRGTSFFLPALFFIEIIVSITSIVISRKIIKNKLRYRFIAILCFGMSLISIVIFSLGILLLMALTGFR